MGWPPALRELKDLLYEVYLAAGAPSLDEIAGNIAADTHEDLPGAPLRDTISRVIAGSGRPQQQADVVAVAKVLARRAAWDADDLARRVRDLWVRARMAHGVGRPIGDLRADVRLVLDRGLGIHLALEIGDARDRFGILPAYVPRDHDARLKTVVDAAVAGDSGIAVLVGESSTGKTRALWEAVRELPDGWRLWHPLTPTAPEAVLAALPDIAPRTVVWLNEAQHYLPPDPLGEQVAAGLRELLTDPSRAPVLIMGTLWLEHWNALTTGDRHAGARALLGGHKIDVPKAFSPADLTTLEATADVDPRLTHAAQHADDAQVTQYLAGVPYLTDRYHAADGATAALIHAAMDARRLGAGPYIPLAWLADAAPGYLTDTEHRALKADWLPKALAYVTAPWNGIPDMPGILTPVNTSGPRNQRNTRRPAAPSPQGPHYLLADYLEQYGRRQRAETIPPIDFWTAAATHAHPTDLTELGNAAWERGMYRDAAQLHKRATAHGSPIAARDLVDHLRTLHPTDPRPAQWAAEHVALDDPGAVVRLLKGLWKAGAKEQAAALAGRAAAHTTPDDPGAVVRLLEVLREAGAEEQVAVLAERAAAHATPDDPWGVLVLLRELREAGAEEQAAALAERAAAHTALDDPSGIAVLLKELWEAGADEQAAALAERAAAHAALDNPWGVVGLLKVLWEAGAEEQAAALAERAAAHATLDDPDDVARLLHCLREAEADEQAMTLAERAAAHTALDHPGTVIRLLKELLEGLREAGADEQAAALAERAAAHAALDNPWGVLGLLEVLWEAGAEEQAAALAERAVARTALDDAYTAVLLMEGLWEAGAAEQAMALAGRAAAHAALDHPGAVARLLQELREAGADEPIRVLLARDPAAYAALDTPWSVAHLLERLREAGADGHVSVLLARDPAAHVALDDPKPVVRLLEVLWEAGADEQATALTERAAAHAVDNPGILFRLLHFLREAGADEQATALTERAAAHTALDDSYIASWLLRELRRAGAAEQAMALAERAAAYTTLDNPDGVAWLLRELRQAGADEQIRLLLARDPAAHVALDGPFSFTALLEELQEAGADEQATTLAERLPATGHFARFIALAGNREKFRLGCEPDGSAAPSWTWDDLD
ncbi:hypothetical protein [Streptomyces longwoodensis]|uniref:hypothetical protein n=1 Tax=Streptomyces longwoodensis TaxID=68231 RepID=UPI0034032E0A